MQIISPSPEPRAPSPEPRGLIFDLGASTFRVRFIKVASILCGLLLLAAAGLKLYGLNYSPFAQYGRLLTPTVQSFAVVWEVLLGCWLMSGSSRFFSWLTALATFTGFAIVSGYLGIIGQASCGCLGVIEASPWAAFALDVSALVLLLIGRPLWTGWASCQAGLKWVGGFTALLAVIVGIGISVFGSSDAAIARLRGESLGVTPSVLDFGTGKPGDKLTATVTVRNWTDSPVRIVDGTADCTCIATRDLPVRIDPGQQADVSVSLSLPSTSGQLIRTIEFTTDCQNQPKIRLRVVCQVEE